MAFAAVVVLGYLLGSCPWGYWLVRIFHGEDVRTVGSSNIGATNVWRTYGKSMGIPVILLDVLKGYVPAAVGVFAVSHVCGIVAGAAAMLGHWRPLFLGFKKGGKMVATGGGVFLGVALGAALLAAAVWVGVVLTTRYVSVASMSAAISLPVLTLVLGYPWSVVAFAAAAALGVVVLHRSNLVRLKNGTEHRIKLRRSRPAGPPSHAGSRG